MTTYAVTGASGQLGRLVVADLLDTVDPSDVVLLSRNPESLAEFAERGATVRAVDFEQPGTIADAFAGVDRLLLISTGEVGEARRRGHRAAIDGAVAAGVTRVVYTSVPSPSPDGPALVALDHFDTEEYLGASGLEWVMLRNNLYADMQLDALRQAAASGRLVTNNGAGRVAYVTRADCAAAAVGALVGDRTGVALDITGPEALDSAELAALASVIAGREVAVTDLDDDAFAAGLAEAGLPQPVIDVVTTFGSAVRLGQLAEVSSAVRDLTGQDPTPLRALIA